MTKTATEHTLYTMGSTIETQYFPAIMRADPSTRVAFTSRDACKPGMEWSPTQIDIGASHETGEVIVRIRTISPGGEVQSEKDVSVTLTVQEAMQLFAVGIAAIGQAARTRGANES